MKCICKLCNHVWESNKKDGKAPACCPRCKRYDWKDKTEKEGEK